MYSIQQLYKIGIGPSSSHTMAPAKAAQIFLQKNPQADSFCAVLYGSLALTGKGHGTDIALKKVFDTKKLEIKFDLTSPSTHPNTVVFFAYDDSGKVLDKMEVISTGGGDIKINGENASEQKHIYPHATFEEIKNYCTDKKMRLWQYVLFFEGCKIHDYLAKIYRTMEKSMFLGLHQKGELHGGLGVVRRASSLIKFDDDVDFSTLSPLEAVAGTKLKNESEQTYENRIISAFAFAVSESNASCCEIATAPTCGSSGVLPAAFKFYELKYQLPFDKILHGLMTAGLIGNLVKHNASISGAECGCQAEIGTACAMTAAGLAEMMNMSLDEIEFSAEVALEHHLGLTCDPINGLVQIPCIERNAVAAMRAINAMSLATFLTNSRKITLDTVIGTMYETGKDLNDGYRETAQKGLAKHYPKKQN